MAPDFTTYCLTELFERWGQSSDTAPPKPAIIDRRDASRMAPRKRSADFDLTIANKVSVGAQPTTDNTASGPEFAYRYNGGADVLVEAQHADKGGHIANAQEWTALVGEVRRILTHDEVRKWPIEGDGVSGGAWTLILQDENDDSQNYADHWFWSCDAMLTGREGLG